MARFNEAVGFGLDFMVVNDPRAAGTLEGKGSMSWGGAAGTWFWVDPTNDVIFVGMIQRMGDTGGDPLGSDGAHADLSGVGRSGKVSLASKPLAVSP